MDTRDDEKERGITIKSTAISMFFAMDPKELEAVSQASNGECRSEKARKEEGRETWHGGALGWIGRGRRIGI